MPHVKPKLSIAEAGTDLGLAIQQHIDTAFRVILRGPGVVVEPRFSRLVTGEAHPFGNFALVKNASDASAVDAAIEPLQSCGAPAAVIFTSAVPADIEKRLNASGFHIHDPMPAMAVEIDRLPPMPSCTLPKGVEFARIDPRTEGPEWGRAFAEGYELPPVVGDAFAPDAAQASMAADASMQYFAICRDGRQIATTMLFLADGYAGIYAVATIAAERRQGLGAYLTAAALRAAHPLGYRVGILQASPAGYPVYRRLGFSDHGAVPLYVRMP